MRLTRLNAAIVAGVTAAVLASAPAASAMTTTTPSDKGAHPGVVALLVTRVVDGQTQATMYCSGMLVAPKVVLTASHCDDIINDPWFTSGDYGLAVTNDQDLPKPPTGSYWFEFSKLTTARVVPNDKEHVRLNPDYRKGYREDVSAQVLDTAIILPFESDYGVLPEQGALDKLQANGTLRQTSVLVLGYGSSQKVVPANGDVAFPDTNERRIAQLPLVALTPQWLKESQSIAKGQDGACYGDSGGPSVLPAAPRAPLVVVGVTSTGDGPCFATNVASRTDTASALEFMRRVMASVF